ncbi:MAG: hypothetical protein LIP08_02985 [Bacteroides sp.]|nr:hypothetical protein [Bacteroides sp.]
MEISVSQLLNIKIQGNVDYDFLIDNIEGNTEYDVWYWTEFYIEVVYRWASDGKRNRIDIYGKTINEIIKEIHNL